MTKLTIIALLMAIECCACVPASAQAPSADSQPAIQLHVQPRDSLTNLFGNDWREVYQLNQCECRFASYINDGNDPNFIIAGSSLTVPSDVHLTDRAFERIGFAKEERDDLRRRLEMLIQAGGDTATSAEPLHAQLDGATSLNDLTELDKATTDLEAAEVQDANRASAVPWFLFAVPIVALLAAILAKWSWWDELTSGSRRLDAAIKMVDTIAG